MYTVLVSYRKNMKNMYNSVEKIYHKYIIDIHSSLVLILQFNHHCTMMWPAWFPSKTRLWSVPLASSAAHSLLTPDARTTSLLYPRCSYSGSCTTRMLKLRFFRSPKKSETTKNKQTNSVPFFKSNFAVAPSILMWFLLRSNSSNQPFFSKPWARASAPDDW